ncbi:NUDIX domain-containing protein [Modestobacter sp. I12A-02628]|uniref:NUDIX hydrolase n=1 Tax=Goekera deserti TaxID=2497753 RepID=A0A7K3WH95_9ACTN|nr:bifunctional NUDIX hydrolase/histidine phosphatase family protein [Goekera deserti]MPQ97311.1 NUDIX domain-containing protein [Goekera deserti]NDI50178.1 NUDIX domain-containing protein [Goekera deserti]NEL55746.1 NUDIX hydrolase [Goekera deserti]
MRSLAEPPRPDRAAGGALWRHRPDGVLETAVVHRPKYDDWSLPKGKLEPGEHPLLAAVREVGEETGLQVVVGRRSVQTRYEHRHGPKRVDYWLMQVVGGDFVVNDEVDELRWAPLPEAAELCTHDHDRAVLADLGREDHPRAPRLLLVRHASAGDSADFDGPDRLRPLDSTGRRQAARLADVLPLFGVTDVRTAQPTRCRQTVTPLAERLGLPLGDAAEMGEEQFSTDPQAGLQLIEHLMTGPADQEGAGVTVVCSQGGAIPSALLALGVRWQGTAGALWPPSAKASVWALAGRRGGLLADYYRDVAPDPADT